MKIRRLAAVAALVLLSSCNVGPNYHKPSVTTPDTFRGSIAATASDSQSIADQQWCDVFKDEQLQELIRTALSQNYDLRNAFARVEAARGNLGIRRADQYPTIGAGGAVIAVQPSEGVVAGAGPLTPTGVFRERTFGSLFLDLLSYEVDLWGRLRRATEAARAELLAMDWS
jgi:multidrug efflux system outer membrane protein